ncbi:hypothetical protein SPRG_05380 [Saprolegnia parasitica CBS 223.65]|uniref:EF-hand domain-containing protein n=1 Tax=Saprolegnia parasitica (strain CBS 223.65) TaxID=695850 RepID=A0A067CQR6_SAPPC|nr:hypothetical protein SPRG_05380 [Saprolegnia parasitica CBS 223.65]KDO29137.1 hypothetical protein SPRG_05380 [Saprolegnia parasitica CBS 223.65]|eukprot:XP_012200017.1 hypothetical protein SPRG_05380 [Saprolegnia parasitica CBS 223.65]
MGDEAAAMAVKLGLRSYGEKKSTYHDNASELFSTVPGVPNVARRRPHGQRSNATFMELMLHKTTTPPAVAPLQTPVVLATEAPPKRSKSNDHVYAKNQVVPIVHDESAPSSREESGQRPRQLGRRLSHEPDAPRALTPASLFADKCHKLHLVPEPIVVKARAKCRSGRLHLGSYSMGDQLVGALAESLAGIETLTHLNLHGNRLTTASMGELTPALLGSSVQALDLSWNNLGLGGVVHLLPLLSASHSPLLELNLENNLLGDKPIVLLANALADSPQLQTLNLTRCNIGHEGAMALGSALKYVLALTSLHLSWNKIRGAGAAHLARGLQHCSTLRTLDLSWNSFGSLASSEALVALCDALQMNKVLTHLDVSHNRLRAGDCDSLGAALASNQTLRGLHLAGNDVEVDAYGFVLPNATPNDPALAHIFTRIGDAGSHVDRPFVWEKRSNCWLCEHWVETRLLWRQSGQRPKSVVVRAEFDYWKPHHLCPSATEPNVWEVYRMVPPGTSQFFFVVDDAVVTTDAHVTAPFQSRLWGGVKNRPRDLELPHQSLVNTLCVVGDDASASKALPRLATPAPGRVDDWFPKSVFASYHQDTASVLAEAFEVDWSTSRLSRMAKEAGHVDALKAVLSSHFALLKDVFRHYATSGGADPFTLASNAFADFLADADIVDANTCTRAEAEMCFIAASSSGPKLKWNTRRSLIRFQFLEALVALASSKFLKSKRAPTVAAAVQLLIEQHVTRATWHDSQTYRGAALHTPALDAILKDHLHVLKELFTLFAGSIDVGDGRGKRLSYAEFVSLCEQAQIIDEGLATRDVKLALMRAKETEVFDATGDGEEWKKIGFPEFLEACARLADAKDLGPFYQRVKSSVFTHGTAPSDVVAHNFLQVHSTLPRDWAPNTGDVALKLPIVLKLLCVPVLRARKLPMAPLLVKQISLVAAKLAGISIA